MNNSFASTFKFETRRWGPRILAAGLAGLVASIPMAGVMVGLNRVLPGEKPVPPDKYQPLPPKQITTEMEQRAGAGELASPGRRWDALTWLGHLGYGAAAAGLYPLVTRPMPAPNVLRGMLFALVVWAASYLGWIPAVGILPPATEIPPRRNAVMIFSHLVWGALIGLIAGWLDRKIANRQA